MKLSSNRVVFCLVSQIMGNILLTSLDLSLRFSIMMFRACLNDCDYVFVAVLHDCRFLSVDVMVDSDISYTVTLLARVDNIED